MSTEHLPAGRYRLTVDIETDGHGFLYPHDTAAMTMLDWWAARGARFEPIPPPQCDECGWWLTTSPVSCPSCGAPTGLGVSGEDRSEPTPAPQPCPEKGIDHDTGEHLDCELGEGHDGWWHQNDDNFWRVGAPAHVLAAAKPEVVTPEGPA